MLSFGTHHKTPLPLKPSKETGSEEERLSFFFFCRRCLQLYLNSVFFFFYFIFFPAPNPGERGNSEREGGLCHPVDSRCKGGFQNNRWGCLEGGVWKENKVGRGGMRGLYLHRSQRPERRRSEASRCIFRADEGNAKCLGCFVFFSFAVLP